MVRNRKSEKELNLNINSKLPIFVRLFFFSGYNESEYHGLFKTWSNSDVQRLLHMLVLEEYLRETLIFVRDIPLAYLKIGLQVDQLMSGKKRIEFAIENVKTKKGKKNDVNLNSGPSSAKNEALKKIQEDCYSDLLQKCHDIAQERNMTVGSVMNNQALKLMSESMPATEEAMMKIPHVTKANFDKFGKELLEIVKQHAGERAILLLDMESMEDDIDQSDDDTTNWSSLAASGASSIGSSGRKRKRAFGGNFRRKKGTAKKSATPKRRRTAAKITGKRTTTTANRAGGSKFALLKPRAFDPSML